jgi:hypothetical protein
VQAKVLTEDEARAASPPTLLGCRSSWDTRIEGGEIWRELAISTKHV